MGIQDSKSQTVLHTAAENDNCPDKLIKLLITRAATRTLNTERGDGETALGLWVCLPFGTVLMGSWYHQEL